MTSIHAEVNCIKNIKKLRKKYRLLVLKFNKQGELVDSKPCSHCRETMIRKGFTDVYYSTNEGIIEKSKLKNLETRLSTSQKLFREKGFKKE